MKYQLTTLTNILQLHKQGDSDRIISAKLNISRHSAGRALQLIKSGKTFEELTHQKCTNCELVLSMTEFSDRQTSHGNHFCELCKVCVNEIIDTSHIGKTFEQFIPPTDIIDPQILEIIELRNKGVVFRDIAKIICIGVIQIYEIVEQFKIPSLPKALLAQFQTERICSKEDCKKAGQVQPISEFAKRTNNKTGKISYDSHCHKCKMKDNKERNNKSYKKNPAKWKEYKIKGKIKKNETTVLDIKKEDQNEIIKE